jgi:hypothetical protein
MVAVFLSAPSLSYRDAYQSMATKANFVLLWLIRATLHYLSRRYSILEAIEEAHV